MNIAITGGRGYIGTRLASGLMKDHNIILLAGNKSYVTAPSLPVPYRSIDWDDDLSIRNACKNVDLVIHAAGMNASSCTQNPSKALYFNGLCTAKLVDSAVFNDVRRILYLSTAHVYHSPLTGYIDEDTPTSNLHPYATSHVAGESAVLYADLANRIHGTVLRVSNLFGAPAADVESCWDLAVNQMALDSIQHNKISLRGSGLDVRDFMPLSYFTHIIALIVQRSYSGIVNIGSGYSRNTLDMASLVADRHEFLYGARPAISMGSQDCTSHTTLSYKTKTDLPALTASEHYEIVTTEIDQLLKYCRKKRLS